MKIFFKKLKRLQAAFPVVYVYFMLPPYLSLGVFGSVLLPLYTEMLGPLDASLEFFVFCKSKSGKNTKIQEMHGVNTWV